MTSARHQDALCRACQSLEAAVEALKAGTPQDLVSIDIREARSALGEITGRTVDEQIIDRIFENFCLGK